MIIGRKNPLINQKVEYQIEGAIFIHNGSLVFLGKKNKKLRIS